MSIKINKNLIFLEIDGTVLATLRRWVDDWWEVDHRPRLVHRNQPIAVLAVTELLESKHHNGDPVDVGASAHP
jgi:hypothetical protein